MRLTSSTARAEAALGELDLDVAPAARPAALQSTPASPRTIA